MDGTIRLTCEFLHNPLGVQTRPDRPSPLFLVQRRAEGDAGRLAHPRSRQ